MSLHLPQHHCIDEIGYVGTQIETTLKPLTRIELGIDTTRETLERRVLGITLLIQVTSRCIYIEFLTAYGTRHIVFLAMTCTLYAILPIEVVITCETKAISLRLASNKSVIGSIIDISLGVVTNQMSCSILSSCGLTAIP